MNTWQAIRRLALFRPGLFVVNMISITLMFVSFQIGGLVSRAFFDLLSGDAAADYGLLTLIIILISAGLMRIGFIYGVFKTNMRLINHISTLLHKNMLMRILERPGAQALKESPGEAVSRFRGDTDQARNFPLFINDQIANLFFTVAAITVMWAINSTATIVALVPLLIVLTIAKLVTARIEAYRKASRKATGVVTGFIGEIFGAVEAVKVATAEESVLEQFREINTIRSAATVKDVVFNALLNSGYMNTVAISTGLILILVGRQIEYGSFTVGDLALFVFNLWFLSNAIWMMGNIWSRYRQLNVSVERMTEIAHMSNAAELVEYSDVFIEHDPPEIEPPELRKEDTLQELHVRGLAYRYPATSRGIEPVDFSLPRGSLTVITGRIGSGKSTLLRVLLGLLPRNAGEIFWNDRRVDDPSCFMVPPRCAYTSQLPWLFSGTLRENLLMGAPENTNLEEVISATVMDKDLEDWPDRIETVIGPKGTKLSGGQIQRAAAARMLVRRTELMVLDDLSSALDVETEQQLWKRVLAASESTFLVVSHRRAILQRADRILLMKEGRIIDEGRLEELLGRSAEMRAVLQV